MGPVAHGGHCVARHEGQVVFVRHALPGERVLARVTAGRAGDRFLRADAERVLSASPDRVAAPCPYAGPGRCGGCDWQHADPAAQRRLKAAVVAEQLRRLAGIEWPVEVIAVPGSPDGLGWRTRVQYAVDADGTVGLHRHRSHEIEPIDGCLIAHPLVEALGIERQPWPGVSAIKVVAAVGSGECLVETIEVGSAPERADEYLTETAAGRTWRVTGTGFWQVHAAAADTLAGCVLQLLAPRPGEWALDLYSGVGLFAGVLAERLGPTGRVVAIEGDRGAVEDGRHNLAELPGVRLLRGRVDRTLPRTGWHRADLVVLDPPRSGAGRAVVDRISLYRPRAIAYVACDPAALARDLGYFAGHGYRLTDLRAYDLFPMTHHVECVALLTPTEP